MMTVSLEDRIGTLENRIGTFETEVRAGSEQMRTHYATKAMRPKPISKGLKTTSHGESAV